MKRQQERTEGRRSTYLSLTSGEITQLPAQAMTVTVKGEGKYLRLPAGAAAVVGPMFGLAYILFLPLLGLVALLWLLGKVLARGFLAAVRGAQTGFVTTWRQLRTQAQKLGRPAGQRRARRA